MALIDHCLKTLPSTVKCDQSIQEQISADSAPSRALALVRRLGSCPHSDPRLAKIVWGGSPNVVMAIFESCLCTEPARSCVGAGARLNGDHHGWKACFQGGQPMSCWWRWRTRWQGSSLHCSAGPRRTDPDLFKLREQPDEVERYCEGDD